MGKGSEPGAALFCDTSEVSLPSDLTAVKPSNFLYVLKFSSSTNAIETCHYESGYSLTRYQDFWTVTMISTLTGKVTHSQQFAGSYPDACPSSRYFTIGDYGDSTSGGPPGEDAVIAWLRQTLK
jgi:hypothetical protein